MSQENVEVVRALFDALNRRAVAEAVQACVHPDVELHSLVAEAEGEVFRGHDGFRRWFGLMIEVFPDWRVDVDETRSIEEYVLGVNRLRGHGAGSGVPVEGDFWHLTRFREGKLVWIRFFGAEREALEAVGLRE